MFDVITVGSSTIDVFAKTKVSELIKLKGGDLLAYPVGSKLLIDNLQFTTGGGATNTAVCLARLKNKVACITKTGSGANSQKVINHLKRENIDCSFIVKDKKGRTGYSIILDSIDHDRTILTFKGSNNDLRFSELSKAKLNTKWFFFCTMMGESFNTLKKLAKYAEDNNIKIAFNASPYLAEKGIAYSKEILKRTDIFVLNKEEARLMSKKDKVEDCLKALQKLAKIVVITDGKNQVYAYEGNLMYTLYPRAVKVVESTGAGDAFASTFLAGMMKKDYIEFALKLACTNAQSVVQHFGAKNKLLSYNQALSELKKHPLKVTKRQL